MEQNIQFAGVALDRVIPRQPAALEQGQPAHEPCDAARLWSALCRGRLRIAGLVETDEGSIALLEEHVGDAEPLAGRQREVLERVLTGQSGKEVSSDLGLSNSTICGELHSALRTLGVAPRLTRVPVILFQLCTAATSGRRLDASLGRIGRSHLVVSVARLRCDATQRLSPAEVDVFELYLRGRNYHEIAGARGTRPRTISNQIASIFQKLGVSGRANMIATLLQRDGAPASS